MCRGVKCAGLQIYILRCGRSPAKSVLSIREAFDNETCQDTFCRWSSNVLVLRQIQSPSPGIWPPAPWAFHCQRKQQLENASPWSKKTTDDDEHFRGAYRERPHCPAHEHYMRTMLGRTRPRNCANFRRGSRKV
jgi:hypothetical protein